MHVSAPLRLALCLLSVCAAALTQDDGPPRIVSLSPAHEALEVDATKVTQLVAVFDRPMSQGGWSFCGGGPKFPKFKDKPRWKDAKTIVVDVELQPDHEYALSLNCPVGQNFRSADGVALAPVPWSFATLPEQPLDPRAQQAQNRKSLDALLKVLASSYSYYDLRITDWKQHAEQHRDAILGAGSTRAWAAAAAKMLEPTEDIHLYLRYREQTYATGRRAVDSLFRPRLLSKYLAQVTNVCDNAIAGRTEDGIGYLLIASWASAADIDAVEKALGELRTVKALIVDVRPNSGGDERLAQRIAAWFVDGRKVYARNRIRVRAGKSGFGPILDRAVTGNRDPNQCYVGPIAVLTSRYVMSSNESFVLMLRQAPECTVVGQPTFGSSGNPKPHDLPNGVTIFVPCWQDLRPDGTCFEGEGLAPDVDVPVDPVELDKRDPILERALELLREKGK